MRIGCHDKANQGSKWRGMKRFSVHFNVHTPIHPGPGRLPKIGKNY
jgi:hypothetical protein